MSIDSQVGELIAALKELADSNKTLAAAYASMAGAKDNGPIYRAKEAKAESKPARPATPPPVETQLPLVEDANKLTLADVRQAVMDIGDRDKGIALINQFGAEKLSDIPVTQWPGVIEQARALQAATKADPLL